MRSSTPPALRDALQRFERWKPAAQEKALEQIRQAELADWHPFYCRNRTCNGQAHVWPLDDRECPWRYGHRWSQFGDRWACADPLGEDDQHFCGVEGAPLDDWLFPHARPDQRPPTWRDSSWLTLFLRGGRGSGKTKTGAEITKRVTELVPRITLIGATGPDLRTFMVEGESGLLSVAAPGEQPKWEPSKKQITWPNGCVALGYSAEEPDRLRGQNAGFVWADEPAHYPLAQACWDNMLFGLRKGDYPKIVATSTPKPTEFVKTTLLKDPFTVDRVVSTNANLSNLSPVFRRVIVAPREGTRIGRQELEGEILDDVEGSLWKWEMIHYKPIDEMPELQRIVIGIDPAGTKNKRSDETGIVVVGFGHDKNFYVLADYTGRYSPNEWGSIANTQYREWRADALVPERTYGEDMVIFVLENTLGKEHKDLMPRIRAARSRRGKDIRAEPVVALYEKHDKITVGKVFHVGEHGQRGDLQALDDELTTWVPGVGDSPNRIDALVHAMTEIGKVALPTQFADPHELLKDLKLPVPATSARLGLPSR